MIDKKKLSKEDKKAIIETELYILVEAAIEGEYDMDRLNNLVYKEDGRQRAIDKIKELIEQWEEEYDIPQDEIRRFLINSFHGINPACKSEGNEIICILSEMDSKEKQDEDILEKDIQDNEKDV